MRCLDSLLQNFLGQHHCQQRLKHPQIHALLITTGFFVLSCSPHAGSTWKTSAVFAYNRLINSYCRCSPPDGALHLFVEMLQRGLRPNHRTFPYLFKAATSTSASSVSVGQAIHGQAIRRGLHVDDFTNSAAIVFYTRLLDLDSAQKAFDEVLCPDTASCNAMLNALCANGDVGSALRLFEGMTDHDVISWTSLVNGHTSNGRHLEAIELFKRWMSESTAPVRPNEAMLVSVLSACANLDGAAARRTGSDIHGHIVRSGVPMTAFLGTALIDTYGKHGLLRNCRSIFDATDDREVCTWNAMIASLAINGKEVEALHLFDEMRTHDGLHPNGVTFVAALTACARAQLVDDGLRLFESMRSEFGVAPSMEHYGCVVDLLSRGGLLAEATEFIGKMPFEADASVWGALLGACKAHGEGSLGARVGAQVVALQPWHSGRYVVLRNIFEGAMRWEDAWELKQAMEKVGVRKTTGYSLVGSPYF